MKRVIIFPQISGNSDDECWSAELRAEEGHTPPSSEGEEVYTVAELVVQLVD